MVQQVVTKALCDHAHPPPSISPFLIAQNNIALTDNMQPMFNNAKWRHRWLGLIKQQQTVLIYIFYYQDTIPQQPDVCAPPISSDHS